MASCRRKFPIPIFRSATSGSRESETLVYTIKADLPSERIEEYVKAHVSTPLSQVEGVGRVVLSGVTPFEWVVTFLPKAMEAAGITASDLALAFQNYFRSDVIGMTALPQADGSERSIVLKLRNRAGLDFGEIPVARRNGRIYYLRDFATARWREALPTSYFRHQRPQYDQPLGGRRSAHEYPEGRLFGQGGDAAPSSLLPGRTVRDADLRRFAVRLGGTA